MASLGQWRMRPGFVLVCFLELEHTHHNDWLIPHESVPRFQAAVGRHATSEVEQKQIGILKATGLTFS
eukprot:scaffold45740_cov42-Attheya_sp.AAC.1